MERPQADLAMLSLTGPGKRRCGDAASWIDVGGGHAVAVADGVGTRACDHLASETAVASALGALSSPAGPPERAVAAAFESATERVRDRSVGPCRGMRTTLVVALWPGGDRAWVASVGDSRAYRLARGQMEAQLLTSDDTGIERVPPSLRHLERGQPLYRQGLTQSVGQAGPLGIEVRETALLPGESLVLATDGMWSAPRFRGVLTSCAALDLQYALDDRSALQRDDDASIVALRRSVREAASPAAGPGVADTYVGTVVAWARLDGAVAQADWAGVESALHEAAERSLQFGRRRLVSLADRIASTPGAERSAFDAVLDLARAQL